MMPKTTVTWLGVVLAIFFWASNFNAIQAIHGDISPFMAATLRLAVASLVLLLLRAMRAGPESALTLRDKGALFFIALVGVLIQNFAIFNAMQYTSPVNAAIVAANMPLAGILLSAILLHTHIYRFHILGALISFGGVLLVITQGQFTSQAFNPGDLLMLIALISGCLYTILAKRWVPHVPLSQQLRWMLSLGMLQMSVIVCLIDTPIHAFQAMTTQDAALLVYMGLGGTLVAYYFWLKGARDLGPDRVTSLFNLMPVFTVLISISNGGRIEWTQAAGIVLVGCGVIIGNAYPVIKLKLKQNSQQFA
ncbi:DMT family transporter [Photobacterium sp. TY1-4]|uniref:DMT family transporter n=1 Tax=Photobacterium sp. TY1-4 TaxID=2899122 RepID=UPI0021BEB4A1|nr:DMT family transporter [Photobacterium sp. TY1-4]UXI03913.1 DMT family transporter [Photobacterium sp. TY1-4]